MMIWEKLAVQGSYLNAYRLKVPGGWLLRQYFLRRDGDSHEQQRRKPGHGRISHCGVPRDSASTRLTVRSRIAADGKTLTTTVKGTDLQGKPIDGTNVYEKQWLRRKALRCQKARSQACLGSRLL